MINDYVVYWSTANPDNVAAQLMRFDINSFAIQNQASHLTSNPAAGEFVTLFYGNGGAKFPDKVRLKNVAAIFEV